MNTIRSDESLRALENKLRSPPCVCAGEYATRPDAVALCPMQIRDGQQTHWGAVGFLVQIHKRHHNLKTVVVHRLQEQVVLLPVPGGFPPPNLPPRNVLSAAPKLATISHPYI